MTLLCRLGAAGLVFCRKRAQCWLLSFCGTTQRYSPLELVLVVDLFSSRFIFTVGVISASIFIFSQRYIGQEKFFWRFHRLVALFVASIVLLILSPNLVSLLLGWDGLGVTSYLLVIYFQSSKSYNAGILTALSNRVGDVLILVAIGLSLRSLS